MCNPNDYGSVDEDVDVAKKAEPFCPPGGEDVLDFVRRRVRALTKEELAERVKKGESITLHHKDIYEAYIADGLIHNYVYIPPNDHLRHAMAYAMAKVYGAIEEKDAFCDLHMNGYKGYVLCEE